MSYKVLKLSPSTGANGTQTRIAIQSSKGTPSDSSDTRFLRSWLVYDSELDDGKPAGRINWNVALGLLLILATSAAFWAGIGFLIAQGK
jgi:hypothetical protein